MEIFIRPATENEVNGISDFLEEHFSTGNPMELAYIHKQDGRKKGENTKDDKHSDFILKAIIEEHVLVAVELSTTSLVGVLISDIIDSNSNGHLLSTTTDTYCGNENSADKDIPNFLAYINAKSNVRHRFNIDKCFLIEIVGVHRDYRQRQIAEKLFAAGFHLAKSKKCTLISVDCTNIYTSKIAEKLGMECVSSVSYDEYNDHLGKRLFVPIPPNMEIKTFAKKM